MDRLHDISELSPSIDGSAVSYEEPEGTLEQEIARAWSNVLRVHRVGRDDNFFELGGNSQLGMDVTELLAQRLGIQVPVVMLFQYPTVREIAREIEENGEA